MHCFILPIELARPKFELSTDDFEICINKIIYCKVYDNPLEISISGVSVVKDRQFLHGSCCFVRVNC